MDRSDVIDNIGSPLATQKRGDLNIWSYRLASENRGLSMKEVHFRDDRVVYAGDPVDWSVKGKRSKASEGEAETVEAAASSTDFKTVEPASEKQDPPL